MEHRPYAVLVRTDEQNRIIEINSSAFVADAEGWVQIDEVDGLICWAWRRKIIGILE